MSDERRADTKAQTDRRDASVEPRREWRRDEYVIRTDPRRIDVEFVHAFLTESYWAKGIPLDAVRRSIENSLPFGLSFDASAGRGGRERPIGFARVITDYVTFGYLADVFVIEEFRGRGLSRWLMETVIAHPDLQGFRRWVLLTRDAHGLYAKFGFAALKQPDRYMELWDPDVYLKLPGAPE